jgi:hypothetical protein
MDFLPWVAGLFWEGAAVSNHWIPWMFLPLCALALAWARRAPRAFENYFTALLLCLPSVHAWYFAWAMPWLVLSRNWGALLLSVSGFAYFWVWRTHELTGRWETAPAERLLLWLPFVAGWLVSLSPLWRRLLRRGFRARDPRPGRA